MEPPLSHNLPTPEAMTPPGNGRRRPPRVLIVRIGAMGDVLHAMPAVAALRERHPDWFLAWAIEPGWSELLQSAGDYAEHGPFEPRSAAKPLVDLWCPVPAKTWKRRPFAASTIAEIRAMRAELRGWEFDFCIDMQGAIKSAVVGRMAAAKMFAGPAEPRERQAAWLYSRRIAIHGEPAPKHVAAPKHVPAPKHVIDQACELLGSAVCEAVDTPLRAARVALPVDDAAERWCDAALADVQTPFVLIAPAAGWGAKRWPAQRFGELAAKLAAAGFPVLVNAASFGDGVALRVIEASGEAAKLVPCTIGQMIALTRRSALVIAGDTGPLHLAAALERPVVALFGPTDPARNGPYGTRAAVLRHPSSQRNHKRHADTEAGLRRITVAEVVEAALGLLQGPPPPRTG